MSISQHPRASGSAFAGVLDTAVSELVLCMGIWHTAVVERENTARDEERLYIEKPIAARKA